MIDPPMHYFNEFDTHAAEMLRNLRTAGIISDGRIDARSIADVMPADLAGYDQCHFFAGVGVWGMALRLAGWPENRRVWTGSCPCQPFSVAGKGKGEADERHLWPVWFKLIEACRPECLFGEQVASPAARDWFDGVCSDLESIGYTCGAVIVGAHSAGADHQRQRLYWMAYAKHDGLGSRDGTEQSAKNIQWQDTAGCGYPSGMAYAETVGRRQERKNRTGRDDRDTPERRAAGSGLRGAHGSMVQPIGTGLEGHPGNGDGSHEPGRFGADSTGSTAAASDAGFLADSESEGSSRRGAGAILPKSCEGCGNAGTMGNSESHDQQRDRQRIQGRGQKSKAGGSSFWDSSHPLLCRDGKWRRVPSEPAFFPLVDGVASRDIDQVRAILQGMGHSEADVKRMLREPRSLVALAGKHRTALLRSAGNAIVLQLAAEFITVAMDAMESA